MPKDKDLNGSMLSLKIVMTASPTTCRQFVVYTAINSLWAAPCAFVGI